MIRKIIFPVFFIIAGILFLIIGIRKPMIYKSEARCGGCSPGGSCSLNGEFCEVFHSCDGTDRIIEVYICYNNRWVYSHPQRGGSCFGNMCGSTPIPTPTAAHCNCSGGTFSIHFKASRALRQGESISCGVTGAGNCTCGGAPCTGAQKNGGCTISAGQSECYASNFDCSCKPFNYSCSGAGSASGSFSGGDVINGGSREVSINVPEPTPTPPPQQPPQPPPQQPSPTQPPVQTPTSTPQPTSTPTKTPTPTPTKTPTPTATLTPNPTGTPTLTPVPTETPTPNPTETPTPNPTETPTPTQSTNIISNPSPTPTEIIVVNQQISPSLTSRQTEQQQSQPTIYQTGIGQSLIFLVPILIILLGLIL